MAALRDMEEIYGADTEDLTGDQAGLGPSGIEDTRGEKRLNFHTTLIRVHVRITLTIYSPHVLPNQVITAFLNHGLGWA